MEQLTVYLAAPIRLAQIALAPITLAPVEMALTAKAAASPHAVARRRARSVRYDVIEVGAARSVLLAAQGRLIDQLASKARGHSSKRGRQQTQRPCSLAATDLQPPRSKSIFLHRAFWLSVPASFLNLEPHHAYPDRFDRPDCLDHR